LSKKGYIKTGLCRKLAELKDAGALTEEEFTKKKQELLDKIK